MAAITLGEILKHVEEFEDVLQNFYSKLSQKTTHEGVRLLTEYMSRHSHRIHEFLASIPPERKKTICTTPLPIKPHFPGKHCTELAKLPPDPVAGEVLDAAVSFDECLVQMYHSAAEQPVSQDIKDFFESLIRNMEQDEIELKKIKAMDYF
ncbi:MAG: hypothetical protein ACYTEN_05255 [Planctomycetota bacterium]|jgi:hypothetical protein